MTSTAFGVHVKNKQNNRFCFTAQQNPPTRSLKNELGHHSVPVARLVRRIPARNGRMDHGAQGSRQQGIL